MVPNDNQCRITSKYEAAIIGEEEFEELYRSYYGKVKQYAFVFTRSDVEAQDLAQEVFIRIWNRKDSLVSQGDWSSYLFMVTRNLYLNAYKKESRVNPFRKQYLKKLEDSYNHDRIIVTEVIRIIGEAEKRLPNKQKAVFQYHHLGLGRKEIALKLKVSINTVDCQLADALRSVRGYVNLKLDINEREIRRN